MRTYTTLVINPKGGSGKTTLATNLAAYFAAARISTALMDYDPQGSTLNWLRQRPTDLPRIHGANAAPPKPGRMRSLDMRIPEDTRQLVIDAPAGASGLLLQELLARTHCILIPVAPSPIDIHATANFIRDLLLAGRIRTANIRLAVVANRVRKNTPVYQPLERFLASLNLPLLARLRGVRERRGDGRGHLRDGVRRHRRRAPAVRADPRMGRHAHADRRVEGAGGRAVRCVPLGARPRAPAHHQQGIQRYLAYPPVRNRNAHLLFRCAHRIMSRVSKQEGGVTLHMK